MSKKGKGLSKNEFSFKKILSSWQLYAMLLPGFIVMIIFHYVPMYGITMAFKDIRIGDSIFGGDWVGFKNFETLFSNSRFWLILKNTLVISLVRNFLLWPLPIIFALLIHNCSNRGLGKFVQTASYMPHLLSMVVIVSIIGLVFGRETGIINIIRNTMGMDPIYFEGEQKYFYLMYFGSDVWATLGSNAVVYIAALSAVDPQLIESAMIDGAGKIRRMWYIGIPTILPTIILLLIMSMGHTLSLGYEKALLMQNDLNLELSEILGTYVYKQGIMASKFSYSSAVSLFENGIGLVLIVISNRLSKKFSDTSLF